MEFIMSKFKDSGIIHTSDYEITWHVRHYGGASNIYENLRGLSVSVCVDPGHTKELIIYFPFKDYCFDRPDSQNEFEDRLSNIVQDAMNDGWNPNSRGRAKVWKVED